MASEDAAGERKLQSPVRRVAVLSLLINLSLVAVKFVLSVVSGSLALRADAIHSLVDVFASTALILGLVISARKTPKFPYGLYKVENIVSVLISLLLFLTAYEIVREAIAGNGAAASYSPLVLAAVAALIPVPFLFGRYEVSVGRQHNSPGLVADGSQFTADVLSSSIVFVALLAGYFAIPLDRVAAVIVALFIARAGWGILIDGMRVLLDASVDRETLDTIRSVILAEPAVTDVRNLTGRNSGRYVFVEADVGFRITELERAHRISERIQDGIRAAVPRVDRVVLHLEPQQRMRHRYAVALKDRNGAISAHFGEASSFAIVDVDRSAGRVEEMRVISNPYTGIEKGKGIQVAIFLLTHKPDVVVMRGSLAGKGPGYLFAEVGVEMVQTDRTSLQDFIDTVIQGRREREVPPGERSNPSQNAHEALRVTGSTDEDR
ncbi:cation diffusion facilitator family transporter [Methanoculleus sp.]|uniref:cation diffusion facilitator family transporter n=1 Tax=Methanoculleus sp. TaxID=90427 RepID=UPI00272EA9FF|nr:cation diffusion facilitator family transporter [Methanoculleus sp.]